MGNSEKKDRDFRDLEVWKQCKEIRSEIWNLCKGFPKEEKYRLCDQMIRSSRSASDCIAEGYGRYHYQENIQFCRISRGSLMELIDDLNVCIDEGYFPLVYMEGLKEEGYTVNKMLNGYISYLKKRKNQHT